MKETSLSAQLYSFVTSILDTLLPPENPPAAAERPPARRVRPVRKEFLFYKKVIDTQTQQLAGHLSDISSAGFKLDCQQPVPADRVFRFSINISEEIADKPSIQFTARSRWCKVDPIDPYIYNVGYQLLDIAAEDLEIFNRMMAKYGRDYSNRPASFRRSNKW